MPIESPAAPRLAPRGETRSAEAAAAAGAVTPLAAVAVARRRTLEPLEGADETAGFGAGGGGAVGVVAAAAAAVGEANAVADDEAPATPAEAAGSPYRRAAARSAARITGSTSSSRPPGRQMCDALMEAEEGPEDRPATRRPASAGKDAASRIARLAYISSWLVFTGANPLYDDFEDDE
jgi:hypothetical protein